MGWETGIALGIGAGYIFFMNDDKHLLITSFVLAVIALVMYNYYTHQWFLENKNR